MFKSVVFDIGRTLIGYDKPLSWANLYRPALEYISEKTGYPLNEDDYQHAIQILTKYNTRIYPRLYEVSSTQIFSEILKGISLPMDLEQVKHCFYSYFRRDAFAYPEVECTLKILSDKGIMIGTLSDVAYGMDNAYVWNDISPFLPYIDYPLTSNDVGYRKPSPQGLIMLAGEMHVSTAEIIFVGDEEKDMMCAKIAGSYAVLINREGTVKVYGQDKEIRSLDELLSLFPVQ